MGLAMTWLFKVGRLSERIGVGSGTRPTGVNDGVVREYDNSLLTFDKKSSIITTNLTKGGENMKRLLCVALAILLLCGCTAAPAQTTIPAEEPVLKAGFYICDEATGRETLVHFCFQEDGTGYLSMLGNKADLTWTPDGTI